jgi:cell wall-associated NlpC family hydrolase
MTRRLSCAAVLAAVLTLLAPLASPQAARATTVDQQQAEVERIVDELDRLHTQADILAEDYAEAVDSKRQLDAEIVDAEGRVAAKEQELVELQGDLAEVAVRAYTGNGADVLGPLFSNAESYTADLRSDQYSRAALDAGTGTTDDLDELITALDDERTELQRLRDEVAQLEATIVAKQADTERLTAEYDTARIDAEAKLGRLIEEEEQRRAEEAWKRLQAEAAAAAANAGGGGSGGSGGGSGADPAGGDAGGGDTSGDAGGDTGGGAATATFASVPVSGRADVAVNAALSQRGVPYRYAASSPGEAFDCSGLTHYAWAQAGVYLPRNSRAQAAAVPNIPPGSAQPGDLIFYYSPISHVGIYLGGGSLVHAPNTGSYVKVSSVNWDKVTAVGRPG